MGQVSFAFRMISDSPEQLGELGQAFRLGAVVICKGFDLQPQYSPPRFVLMEVLYEATADIPYIIPVWVNGREYIKQVLNIRVL